MPSTSKDREFSELMNNSVETTVIVNTSALDEAISWIGSNLEPDDVFSDKDLSQWAESNGYVKE